MGASRGRATCRSTFASSRSGAPNRWRIPPCAGPSGPRTEPSSLPAKLSTERSSHSRTSSALSAASRAIVSSRHRRRRSGTHPPHPSNLRPTGVTIICGNSSLPARAPCRSPTISAWSSSLRPSHPSCHRALHSNYCRLAAAHPLRGPLGRGCLARPEGERYEASGVNVTSPIAVSPGSRTMSPVSVRPASARLNASTQFVAGSTQKKSWPAGV